MTTLSDFLNSDTRNIWIDHGSLEIYVRKGPRIIENKRYECFDVANINSASPGHGAWKRFLIELEEQLKQSPYDIVFIENVLNPRFAISLVKNYGFTEVQSYRDLTGPPCFYKKIVRL